MWKNEWNRRAKEISDEIEVVRGGVINDENVKKYAEQEFLSLVEPKEDEIILDAGCMLGDSIIQLADKVKKIYGVDYSEEMVKRAISRLTKLNKTHNVEICVGDATNLGFQDNYFDKVICMSVFYTRIINGCGGKVIETKSFGLWAPYFPMSVIKSIAKIERVLRKSFLSKNLVNIGVDYKIKVVK